VNQVSKGKALAQVRAMLGPQGHVCAESALFGVGIFGTSWRLYAVGRSWGHAVSELRRTLQPAEEWKGNRSMPQVMMLRPKVVTDKPKLQAAMSASVLRKPVGRETFAATIRIRVSA
jgi:hypothetical protein